jgi:hypothetical protein
MSITHIVLFQFKSGLDAQVIKDVCLPSLVTVLCCLTQLKFLKVCTRMLDLKDNCVHPSSQRPYIKASSGGIDNSPEGIQVSPPSNVPFM